MLKTVFLMVVLTDINGYESLHNTKIAYETIEQCQSDLDQYKEALLSLYDNSLKLDRYITLVSIAIKTGVFKMINQINNEIGPNKWFYSGDINPEHGGIIYKSLDNNSIIAYYIGEFSPINFCYFIAELCVSEDYTTHESLLDAYYENGISFEPYTDYKFMKSVDWEFTNETDRNMINKFVRYDFNIWNLIKAYIGVPRHTRIYYT